MKKLVATILISIFTLVMVHAQTMFQKTYGGLGDDVAWKIIQTSDGGYLICGYTTSFGNGMEDAYIIKTDASGTEQWSKTIGGGQNDEAYSAIEDNGNYIIGGITYSYGAGSRDGFLACLDLSGNLIWFKTYGTSSQDYNILRFNKTLDNGFIIAYTLINSAHYKYTLIKTDGSGNVLWTREYGSALNDIAGDIIQTPDSSYVITGFSDGYGLGMHDFLISRADNLGNIMWSKTLGTASDEGGSYYLTCLNNSEAFITGQANNSLFGPDNIVHLKINYLTSNITWAKVYGKAGKTLRAFSGTRTQDNGFASDIHDYTAATSHDMGILKTDSIGNILWVKKYGGSGDDVSYSIWNTTDNGFALVGSTTSFGMGGKDIYFVKTDFLGKSSLTGDCNETTDTLNQGLYVYNTTSPNLPSVPIGNVTNNYNLISSSSTDSMFVPCSPPQTTIGGIINIYTPVVNFSSCNSIDVLNSSGFNIGDRTLLIQMQGAVVDTINNNSNFGKILGYNNCGNYEFATISNISGNTIWFQNPIIRSYSLSGKVQLVSVPQYTDVNVTGVLTSLPWNGTTGGVLVFDASNSLTLNNDIDVTGNGFRGGHTIAHPVCPGCANAPNYFYPAASDLVGEKGEGIFINTNLNYGGGRGAIANGGGSGACKNGGGGGGGNIGSGGLGGLSFNVCSGSSPLASGLGGYQLDSIQSANRFFMGGGAGGGDEDNTPGVGTDGTNGGGIILIHANSIVGNGYQIKSNGVIPPTIAQWDGGGGGGAGGSIILDAQNFSGSIMIHANGAKGSDNNSNNFSGYCHAPGGGGGGGLIWFSAPSTPVGVTATVLKGDSGLILNNTAFCAGTSYGALGGVNGVVLYNHILPASNPVLINAISNNVNCIGGTLQLSVDSISGVTYNWIGPNGFSSSQQNPQVLNVTVNDTGYYVVTLNMNTCTVATDSVHLNLQPIPPINQNASTCSNQPFNLPWGGTTNIAGMYTHVYSSAGGCDSTVNITLAINPTMITNQNASTCSNQPFNLPWGGTTSVAGTYAHIYSNINGCDSTVNITLAINPTSTTSQNASTCSNQPFNLPWGGTTSIGGTYSHIYSDVNGCDSIVNIILTVNPIMVINQNASTCSTQAFNLPWGGTTDTAGIYSHIYTNAIGCDSTVNIILTINPALTTSLNANTCSNQPFNLPWGGTTNTAGTYSHTYVNAIGCDSTVNITLSLNNIFATIVSPQICPGQNYILPDGTSVNVAGTYTTPLISSSGCDSVITTNLTQSPLPPAVSLSSNGPLCEGDTLNLSSTYFPGISYQWIGPNNFYSISYNPSLNNISFADSGLYYLTVSVNNCTGVPYSIDVSMDTFSFTIAVTADSIVCEQDPLWLSANFISGAQYAWTGPTNFSSSLRVPVILSASSQNNGIYSLVITPEVGCRSKEVSTNILVIPEPQNFIIGDHTICEGEPIKLAISNPYVSNYEWEGPSNFSSDKNEIVINPAFTSAGGVYSITGSSVCGIVTDTFSISVIPSLDNFFLPNSFTPNSDLKNDYYYIASLENFEMKIFDRWGQEIIDLTPSNRSWDGTYLNSTVPDGVYVYIFKGLNCKGESITRLGSITVLR